MIACISYQFNDNQRRIFVIDTNLLNRNNRFEEAVRAAVENDVIKSGFGYGVLNGLEFDDDFGSFSDEYPQNLAVELPCTVDRAVSLDVRFD